MLNAASATANGCSLSTTGNRCSIDRIERGDRWGGLSLLPPWRNALQRACVPRARLNCSSDTSEGDRPFKRRTFVVRERERERERWAAPLRSIFGDPPPVRRRTYILLELWGALAAGSCCCCDWCATGLVASRRLLIEWWSVVIQSGWRRKRDDKQWSDPAQWWLDVDRTSEGLKVAFVLVFGAMVHRWLISLVPAYTSGRYSNIVSWPLLFLNHYFIKLASDLPGILYFIIYYLPVVWNRHRVFFLIHYSKSSWNSN